MPDTPDGLGNVAGLFSLADWAAYEGRQIAKYTYNTLKSWGQYLTLNYTVTTGKTLYITDLGGTNLAGAAANADLPQMCDLLVQNSTTATVFLKVAGNGGIYIKLTPPIIIPGANNIRIELFNRANHDCNQTIFLLGFEM